MRHNHNNNRRHDDPAFRQDPVSGEWVLLSPLRGRRPEQFARRKKEKPPLKKYCPFEDPQKSGNGSPLLWYLPPKKRARGGAGELSDWFLQVIRNKYPALKYHYAECPILIKEGMEASMDGVGFHEVIITRPHTRSLGRMKVDEVALVVRAYQERIHDLIAEQCVRYILVFHNHGHNAGASLLHPHSQLVALPIIPGDVERSLAGSRRYYHRYKKCIHCAIVAHERRAKARVICQNKKFVVLTPYASKVNFEMRIYPLKHQSRFESIATGDRIWLADALRRALGSIYKGLDDAAYNFFIHTAPLVGGHFNHYHWHIEILPKTSTNAGMELGTGMEIITVVPEEAAAFLKKYAT